MPSNHFARALKRIRLNAGLTQSSLSEIIGCTPSHVAMLEQGKANPSYMLLENLVRKFELDANILFKNTGNADTQLSELFEAIACFTPDQRQSFSLFLHSIQLTLDEIKN